MKIIVIAKANAKKVGIEKIQAPQGLFSSRNQILETYKVSVKEGAIDGKANRAIVEAVAEYFDVAPSLVNILSGHTNKTKTIQIKM